MSSLNNVRDFSAKDSSIDRSLNSNNRCSTQERVLKLADESIRQISNQLESSQRTSQSHLIEEKVTSSSQQSMANAHTSNSQVKVKKNNFMAVVANNSSSKTDTPKGADPNGLISSVKNGMGSVDIIEKLRI
jgi:hypothetical protein